MSRGALIVLEGVDRCGKTSQTLKLIESLKKRHVKVERLAFPDRTTWTGQIISKYLSEKDYKLSDQAIHLLFSANRWENVAKIEERLNNGVTLIVDRYSYSGVAFSVAKGMDYSWCVQPEIGLPKPDLVFFLNVSAEVQNSRPGFGGERYETSAIQQTVTKIFKELVVNEKNWKEIDANNEFDAVHDELIVNIEQTILNIKNKKMPLLYLTDIGKKTVHATKKIEVNGKFVDFSEF